MLLLTEVVDAIRAIDTEEDILLRACHRVMYSETVKAKDDEWPAPRLAQEFVILADFKDADTTILLEALTLCLATTAAASVKPGKEFEFLTGLTNSLRSAYIRVLVAKIKEETKGEPGIAFERLMAIIRQVDAAKVSD